ncbi:hypothetical protein LTR92_011450 [Exophiala xenobiotica]|nr:hypothetical protein LTR92_011450 [Exophiala xenobiotica]KAK5332133.1 hypothetical protein LTR98_011725 [Exophiala xenobiotica]
MVYVVSQVKADDILALHKTDPALSSIFLAAEYVTQFVQPLSGKLQHERINTSINISDLSHVGVSTFWRLRKLLSTASNMATAHYPETVKRIYRFITIWFKPTTTRKIAVLGHRECATVLRHDLGPENVPKRFGGDLDWEFGWPPELSPDAKPLSKKWVDKWVEGPLRIIDGPGEQWRIIAVGSQNGDLRREEL